MSVSRRIELKDSVLELGGRTLIMGILNTTPDSFTDGGKYVSVEAAVERAREMVREGADLIDVGGESTRPGAQKIPVEEELRRVIPVVQALAKTIGVPISVDTYKAEVAKQALEAGADLINDVWGCKEDPDMAKVIAAYRCPVVLMHNRRQVDYNDLIEDMKSDLRESIRIVQEAGVPQERIILDPGIGFAKTREHNLLVMKRLQHITELGYPVLLGTSRKSFIYNTLNLPTDDVVEGTAATVALGIAFGCQIVRVHDVRQMKRVAMMTDAIMRQGADENHAG